MAKVKAVPIKCDNKRRDEAMFGNRNCNTCVVQQDVLVQVAICPCKLFLNGLLEPRTSGREDKRASEQTGRALSRDISGFGCFLGNNGKRKTPPKMHHLINNRKACLLNTGAVLSRPLYLGNHKIVIT